MTQVVVSSLCLMMACPGGKPQHLENFGMKCCRGYYSYRHIWYIIMLSRGESVHIGDLTNLV